MPQLLTEYITLSYDKNTIKEQKESGRPISLSGIFQKSDEVNGNGRSYPYGVLKREVDKFQDLVKNRRAVGQLDHDDLPLVSLEKVSHLITDVVFDDANGIVRGRLEILNTPMGKIAQELLAGGVSIGISSRGVGSLIKEGDHEKVDEDYQLITWDLVSQGSVPGTWLVKERKEIFSNINLKYPSQKEIERLFSREERIKHVLDQILDK